MSNQSTELDLTAVRARDAASGATWFKEPALGACGRAFIDRRALLREIDQLKVSCEELEVYRDELVRERDQLRLDLAQHNGNATAVLQAQHERDCAVEDVKRLSDALQVLLDEQNDAPLERRRAEWQHACDNARSALRVDVTPTTTEKS